MTDHLDMPDPSESQSETSRLFVADADVYIAAPTMGAAQGQMEAWVAEHMPQNFVIGWTMTEEAPDA